MKGNKVRLSLGRSVAPLAFSLALAGCGGATPSMTGSTQAPLPTASTERQAAGLACADGGVCVIGDIGPGGGVVFYDAGSEQPWGTYLEAAPKGWNGTDEDPKAKWCDDTISYLADAHGASIGIGAGNTSAMLEACSSGAAVLASAYTGGGKTDWFLPTKDELYALQQQQERVGGFGVVYYWSSSQNGVHDGWAQNFSSGDRYGNAKYAKSGVRPVRAFS